MALLVEGRVQVLVEAGGQDCSPAVVIEAAEQVIRSHVDVAIGIVADRAPLAEQAVSYVDHVRKRVEGHSPISLACRYAMLGDDASNDNYYVFLVPDEGYSKISLLHDHLYTGEFAPFHRLDIPFIPHIGIATNPDASKIKGLCDHLHATGLDISGTLDHITVCEYDGKAITDLERVTLKPSKRMELIFRTSVNVKDGRGNW